MFAILDVVRINVGPNFVNFTRLATQKYTVIADPNDRNVNWTWLHRYSWGNKFSRQQRV